MIILRILEQASYYQLPKTPFGVWATEWLQKVQAEWEEYSDLPMVWCWLWRVAEVIAYSRVWFFVVWILVDEIQRIQNGTDEDACLTRRRFRLEGAQVRTFDLLSDFLRDSQTWLEANCK